MGIDLKHARWFGRDRAIGYARLFPVIFLPTLVWFYLEANGPRGSDFLAFWSAARVALADSPAAAYDALSMEAFQRSLGRDHWFPFLNRPPFLAVVLPLGLLPYPLALVVWVGLTYAIWLSVARRLDAEAFWPIAVYPGALVAAWHAQTGFVTAALFLGGMLSLKSRPLLAGALLGALVIKPQLAILVPVALIADRNWRAFAAAAGSACGLVLAAWLAFGSDTLAGFISASSISGGLLGRVDPDFVLRMPTVFADVAVVSGARLALAVQMVSTLAMIGLVWTVWTRSNDAMGKGAVLAVASVLATPYLFHYDLPLLILPAWWLARDALRTGWRPWERTFLAIFYWAPLMMRALALPMGFNLMPLICAAYLALAATRLLRPAPASALP